jgi:RNA polymerase sigma-32 factor
VAPDVLLGVRGITRGMYDAEIAGCEPLSRNAEAVLIERAQAGDRAAVDAIVRSQLKLVVSIAAEVARRFPGASIDDLAQEGVEGLLTAIRKFDPARGMRLSTYAAWWVRAHVQHLAVRDRLLHRPNRARLQRVYSGLNRHRARLLARDGHATPAEIADTMGVSERDVETVMRYWSDMANTVDLDGQAPGVDGTLAEVVPDTGAPQDDAVALLELRRALDGFMAQLTPRERDIAESRLLDDEPRADVGARWGVGSERVRQIEAGLVARLAGLFRRYAEVKRRST